ARLHIPTQRFDARLRVSAREAAALRHWTPVHLHLGSAHAMARVALLESERLVPGADALAQIVAERPLGALAGHAFVLRDASATRTIGGGRVIDPRGRERHRRTGAHLEALRRLEEPDAGRRLAAALGIASEGVDLPGFTAAHNVPHGLALPEGAVHIQ